MKNLRLTISVGFLGILLLSMTVFVVISRAATAPKSHNPYDNPDLKMEEIVDLYHNNINDQFNTYIKMMMTAKPDDPNGKPFVMNADGTQGAPLTVDDCLDPAHSKNYSTFCVGANLLGANSDLCTPAEGEAVPEDLKKFCSLNPNALANKGDLNFAAAMQKRTNQIFQTNQEKSDWIQAMTCLGISSNVCSQEQINKAQAIYQTQKALESATNIDFADHEITFAKQALDQTLSAYDQLRVAWPIHMKYIDIYAALEKYRDKLVSIRNATNQYPSKFIDLTTTSCQ